MAKKNQEIQDENLENVQEALTTSGQWIEQHANALTWAITGIVVVVCGAIALNNYVFKPKAAAAQDETAKAVVYFNQQQWEKALAGDDADCIGFEEIANKYSHYQAGELAALYAGICEFHLGNYDKAAEYVKKFSADDVNIDPAAKQLLGDIYVQADDMQKAVKMFEAAADSKNVIIAPMSLKKAGIVYLELGNNGAAKKAFEQIKNDYPQSIEAQDIDKYLAGLE